MNPDKTRSFLNDALNDYRIAANADVKLRSLQKISQLVEDATDEELNELAAAAIVEEDHRVRGELCYTISRSRKPQLIEVLRGMTQDENSYVRRSAIAALGELGGLREATLAAIDPILDDVDRLRETLTELEEKLIYLRSNVEETEDTNSISSRHEVIMDDYMRCWETYLRYEKELLRDHKGMYVAIYASEIVSIGDTPEELAEILYKKYGSVEALICKIEKDDEPIQMPPYREVLDFQDGPL